MSFNSDSRSPSQLNYSDTDVAGLKREMLRLWYRDGQSEPWRCWASLYK